MMIKNSKKPELIRKEMIKRYYELLNYSQVAKEFNCKRQTVRKWVKRYEREGVWTKRQI